VTKVRIYQATSTLFAALGLFLAVQGWGLGIVGMYGPGAGFFPFLVGAALAAVSVAWLLQITLRTADAELPELEQNPRGALRVTLILAALVAFALLLIPLGFNLTMLLLLLFLLIGFSREHLILKGIVAVLASFGVHYVFEHVLRVPLPYAAWPLLRDLGL
jgi:putative tricarboxylic transport membrane protein